MVSGQAIDETVEANPPSVPARDETPKSPAIPKPNGVNAALASKDVGYVGALEMQRAYFSSRSIGVTQKKSLMDHVEAFISKLSTKNNFWHRICSWLWLPFAFRSGIRMSQDGNTFTAVLPFRRFNRNWYNAMAGAVLLGNSEIAGGTYVFKECDGNFRVVCKDLEYKFLRPCVGPALYRMTPRESVRDLVAAGREFNVILDISIIQVMRAPREKECRVGKCVATFHATPIVPTHKKRRRWY